MELRWRPQGEDPSQGNHHAPTVVAASPPLQKRLLTVSTTAPILFWKRSAATSPQTEAPVLEQGISITSPMVGTFYRAPSPDAKSYVEIGTVVEKGDVVCIIEAMKMMNEIQADARGRVLKILVENGQPIGYEQPLFLLEPL
jgi:acetyl-CoA carboxylase biotin carboxyl carrier protein